MEIIELDHLGSIPRPGADKYLGMIAHLESTIFSRHKIYCEIWILSNPLSALGNPERSTVHSDEERQLSLKATILSENEKKFSFDSTFTSSFEIKSV